MEFNEKLQQLRKQRGLTQEQLAEQLYVSRTAVSKWESGKGCPNIESLKCISKLFSVTIDELLSGDELITLAVRENRSNLEKVYGLIRGIFDIMALCFIFLPLYGKPYGGYIYAVNLLSFTGTTGTFLVTYWAVFFILIGLGLAQLAFAYWDRPVWRGRAAKCSIVFHAVAICLFAATREPYVTLLLFAFFAAKAWILWKQTQIKLS
ncbi:helix-turn-helix domain-containing protein [Butyricicoccus faecihominis]|uniref:helix-turn-helix domain-containing protein n=1 Tax=Butyricicoccus faecihominis TaxID=1712515 RepID=UPI0024799566|nr:helix-turn-helix transcriptional regulator [Butyricicoccus faecihominis]MCQ5129948.1 helix-turn-helix domain-containing protein [Butyricicoccus faecihominis]